METLNTRSANTASGAFDVIYGSLKAFRPLREMVRRVRGYRDHWMPVVWELAGREQHGTEPATVFFQGQRENFAYIARLIFGLGAFEIRRRRVPYWVASRQLSSADQRFSMVFVQVSESNKAVVPQGGYMVPTWVGGEVDVAEALATRTKKESVRADLRAIRREGFEFRISRDAADIGSFYQRMYLPYTRKMFGEGAFVWSLDELRREAPGGEELLLVSHAGQTIAGVYLGIVDAQRINQLVFGVVDADYSWVRRGVLAAMYYFVLKHAAAGGYARISLGGSRAFLNDGVLQFKRKWGMQVTPDYSIPDVLLFRPNLASPAARSFLRNNPFIHRQGGRLRAAVFVGADASAGSSQVLLAHAKKRCALPGLDDVEVFRDDREPLDAP